MYSTYNTCFYIDELMYTQDPPAARPIIACPFIRKRIVECFRVHTLLARGPYWSAKSGHRYHNIS